MTATHTDRAHTPRRAFTLIEILVVIGVIAVLVAIGGVVYSSALSRGERAATEQFLRSVTVAIEQFNTDHGYYPPLLAPDAMLAGQGNNGTTPLGGGDLNSFEFVVPDAQDNTGARPAPAVALRNARYMSVVSLPVYLVGVGDLAPTEFSQPGDADRHDGLGGPGFRGPGPDRAWGGAIVRDEDTHRPARTGRTYGPYLDVASGRNMRRTRDFRPTNTAGEGEPPLDDPNLPFDERQFFVLEDRWGGPIRYYRNWPVRDDTAQRESSLDRVPIELLSADAVRNGFRAGPPPRFDPAADPDLLRAPYALLSAGRDGLFADAGSEANNNGFTRGSMSANYSNAQLFNARFPEGGAAEQSRQRDAFIKSLEDNIRVIP